MFNRKKKEIKELKEKILDKQKEINKLTFRYNSISVELDKLNEKIYADDKIIKALEQKLYDKDFKYYKKYKYAILIDKNYEVKLWNEDRFENNVKEILFNANPYEIPKINIIK